MDYKSGGIPKTIDELKDYCERNGFTSSKTRFFVGFNYEGPKAFGIYKDEETGEFVVYKNKDDGSRAVRYRGTDEEFAVVELYDRLQEEIRNQKIRYAADMAERERNKYERNKNGSDLRFGKLDEEEYIEKRDPYLDNRPDTGGSEGSGIIGFLLAILGLIMVLIFGGGGGGYSGGRHSGYGGYSSYDSNNSGWDSHSWDSGSSGWDSNSWDSGYTDWGSDW